ncbi:hypothetical protein J3F84DRAFT_358982 [Trichoderma pleuroticola]
MPAVLAAARGLPCLGLAWALLGPCLGLERLVSTAGAFFFRFLDGETFDVKPPHFGPFAGVVSPPSGRDVMAKTTKVKG